MSELSKHEQEFVNAIVDYKPPKYKRKIISRKNTDINSPDFHEMAKVYCRAKEDTADIIPILSRAVNSYTVNFEGIIEAIKENRQGYTNLVRFAYAWVNVWYNAEEWRTDGRNEVSTKICKEIANAIERESTDNLLENGYFPQLDKATLNMHKTSVQTATNIFLRVLYSKNKAAKNVIEKYFPNKNGKVHLIMR